MPTTPTKAQLRALPKKQRREVARQVAREERIARERQARRRTITLRVTGAVVSVAVLVGAAVGVRAWVHGLGRGPLNMVSDGILLSAYQGTVYAYQTPSVEQGGTPTDTNPSRKLGITDAVMYVDYSDPDAATLWATAKDPLTTALMAETLGLEIHPIAPDGSASATKAAAALACVAEHSPDQALLAHEAFLEGGQDWSAASLVDAVQKAGIRSDAVKTCIQHGKFTGWVKESTDRAKASVPFDPKTVGGTTLFLAGTPYAGEADDATAFGAALAAAQDAVAKESAAAQSDGTDGTGDGTATPSPSESASPSESPSESADPSATPSPTESSAG